MKCNLAWIKIPREEYNNYDVTIKKCHICRSIIYPYILHNNNNFGDYTCYLCDNDINVKYFCVKCRK